MKIIKLNNVHYLSFNGIILTMNNPYIEATEENINKLSAYIKAGYLIIKDLDENQDKKNSFKETNLKAEEALIAEFSESERVSRFKTKDELLKMTKKELMEYADSQFVKYKPTMNKEQIVDLILE